jgi:ribosomal protein L37AE/L43A
MSDPSALSQIGGWLIIPAAATFLYLAHHAWTKRHPKNTRPVTESTQPVTRRATTPPACRSTGPRGGHYYRANGNTWECAACGDRVPRGQAAPYDQERDLTDREIREVMDDARRITREAAGGVA